MWFDSWDSVFNIIITGIICFSGLVILLRVAGKRTLTKMNAFDFVMTISIGSVLATAITSKDTSIVDGMTALAILIFMQYIIAWLAVRSDKFESLIKSRPAILFYDGEYRENEMKKERITKVEIMAAFRNNGYSDQNQIHLVLLETDGEMSVIPKGNEKDRKYGALKTAESDFEPLETSKK